MAKTTTKQSPTLIIHPEAEVRMIPLSLIDPSPFQTRVPSGKAIREMAASFRDHGMRQKPMCRPEGDRYQLAWGHTRVEAARFITKNPRSPEEAEAWKEIPCLFQHLTLEEMAILYIVENTHRHDLSKLDLARSLKKTLDGVEGMTEMKLAQQLNLTQGHISNMTRILQLPERIIQYIEDDQLSVTQARELMVLMGFDDLMVQAVQKVTRRQYGFENTVNGLMKAVYDVASDHWKPLSGAGEHSWRSKAPKFDTKECANCEHRRTVHDTQKSTLPYCVNSECWDAKQTEAQQRIEVETLAKAREDAELRMKELEAERLMQQAELPATTISQEIPTGTTGAEGKVIHVDEQTMAKIEASYSGDVISEGKPVRKPVYLDDKLYVVTGSVYLGDKSEHEAYQLVPREHFTGEVHTSEVPPDREYEEYYEPLRNNPMGPYHGMLVKRNKEDLVLVGPPVTIRLAGEAPIKSTAPAEDIPEAKAAVEQEAAAVEAEAAAPVTDVVAQAEDILEKHHDELGTRAELINIEEYEDQWGVRLKEGITRLDNRTMKELDDPQQCIERCTTGFHYAYDARHGDSNIMICSNPECMTQKRAALTRKLHSEGASRKRAEEKDIRQALEKTTSVTKGVLILAIEAMYLGWRREGYTSDRFEVEGIWFKSQFDIDITHLSIAKVLSELRPALEKKTEPELVQILVKSALEFRRHHGPLGDYKRHLTYHLRALDIETTDVGESQDR